MRAGAVAQVIEFLSSKDKALSSNVATTKKEKCWAWWYMSTIPVMWEL
jgi:hypothetical protein